MLRLHALGAIAMGTVMSITVTSPVIPLYLDALRLPAAHIGAIIGVLSLALIVTELLAMAMSHRLGRRWTVIVALLGSTVMFATFPLARSLGGLYLSRAVLGAVRGFLWPVLFAEVAELGPAERREAQFAVFWLYFGIAQLFAPALGGWLGERVSLAAPFYAAAVICLLTVPAALVMGTERDPSPRNPLTAYGMLLRRAPGVGRAWLLTVMNTTMFSVYATFVPLHADGRGLGATQIGLIFTAAAVSFIIAQAILGRLATRVPAERLLVTAFLARGLSVAVVPLLGSFRALLTMSFLGSAGGAPVPNALSMRISTRSPREFLVPAMGAFNASADLGFFIGPALGGALAGRGLHWPFVMILPVTLLALLVLWLPEPQPAREGETAAEPP